MSKALSVGSEVKFIIKSADNPPSQENNGGFVIAFVPGQGFQWCKYHDGSKKWQSMITRETVRVTEWLKPI